MSTKTTIEQQLQENERLICEVFQQINNSFDLSEEQQRVELKRIKKTNKFHWKYAVNRLNCESREHVLVLTRNKIK